jgi:hypothetical protein
VLHGALQLLAHRHLDAKPACLQKILRMNLTALTKYDAHACVIKHSTVKPIGMAKIM